MLSLLTFHSILFQIMEVIEYTSQLNELNNVAYLLLISFPLIQHIYHSHLFYSIILMMLSIYWLKSIYV